MSGSEKEGDRASIDVEESLWALDEDLDCSSDAYHSLMISLVRPAITPDEITWKKGKLFVPRLNIFCALSD